MRKYVTLLTAMLCLLFVFGLNAKAETYGDYEYVVRNGTVVISKYNGNEASVEIPSVIDGKKVTVIGTYKDSYGETHGAFEGCDNLKSVTIPNSVTMIGQEAFKYCNNLTSVTIPNSVTTIGDYAFSYCDDLKSVTIPNSVTMIGQEAFYGCNNLTSVTIPNSVTTIGDYAFYGCNNLTSVTIPNSVTTIGDYAFSYCKSLTSVTIPNSMTTTGNGAFCCCESLTSVTIPNSVTTIGNSAFCYCKSLTSVTIPNSVTTIGNSAFDGCNNLTSVTIPNSVTTIGDYAFYDCKNITSITIPNSVTTIGGYALGYQTIFEEKEDLSIEEKSYQVMPGFTITGYDNSGAYYYAIYNDFTFISLTKRVTSVNISGSTHELQPGDTLQLKATVSPIDAEYKSVSWSSSDTDVAYVDDNGEVYVRYDSDGMSAIITATAQDNSGKSASWKITSKKIKVTSVMITGSSHIVEEGSDLQLTAIVTPNNAYDQDIAWSSSDTDVAYVNSDGYVEVYDGTGGKTVTITARAQDGSGKSGSWNITSKSKTDTTTTAETIKVGSTQTSGNNRYTVTSGSAVSYKAPASKKITSVSIPASVKIKGKTFKVTSIANKAFSGCNKLKKVTIKASIKKIGKYAFYNCKKLKTIRIYTKKLTKNNVLTGAFKGIPKKATFYVPKGKKAAYKKILLKRGAKKTMLFKTN